MNFVHAFYHLNNTNISYHTFRLNQSIFSLFSPFFSFFDIFFFNSTFCNKKNIPLFILNAGMIALFFLKGLGIKIGQVPVIESAEQARDQRQQRNADIKHKIHIHQLVFLLTFYKSSSSSSSQSSQSSQPYWSGGSPLDRMISAFSS